MRLKMIRLWFAIASIIWWIHPSCAGPAAGKSSSRYNFTWPVKKAADVEGDILLGGLMMVHEREDDITCGPIMPQGGIQVQLNPPPYPPPAVVII